ncbi:hypothetical protein [Lactiplantibacillus fabifermentans]|uniref:Uncharacterized protein n=2 Tax=Lactiplantibacillus fabifermentans TaxID=483011 RepID=A0A0R2NNY2_9LACO|nr:hypothetical protein [Lactiplantibacillus fabifermentans]ETY73569.1 hypothetical protein LFAB_11705 [Lactiplantibacillus fabifermentans T30PCM01]KRO27464.1 hypothetical protein DY78_GL003212 [Lactiplantibacillus fabifermentans DSM 21115]
MWHYDDSVIQLDLGRRSTTTPRRAVTRTGRDHYLASQHQILQHRLNQLSAVETATPAIEAELNEIRRQLDLVG